jgi:hypothetical protein
MPDTDTLTWDDLNCPCPCHRGTGIIHAVPCCHSVLPDEDLEAVTKQMHEEARAILGARPKRAITERESA